MSRPFDLERSSHEFSIELGELLNRTVCHGVKMSSVVTDRRGVRTGTVVGYKITKRDQDAVSGIPLTLGKKPPKLHLGLSFRLAPDHAHRYLMVTTSVMLLSLTSDTSNALLHYDYERDKHNEEQGYPEAHLQICASSPDWEEGARRLNGSQRLLERLHLPVGGRRFRPTVEDLIEFLVCEGLAEGRQGWREVIEAGRMRFREKQLRAAIRSNPDIALTVLHDEGLLPATPA